MGTVGNFITSTSKAGSSTLSYGWGDNNLQQSQEDEICDNPQGCNSPIPFGNNVLGMTYEECVYRRNNFVTFGGLTCSMSETEYLMRNTTVTITTFNPYPDVTTNVGLGVVANLNGQQVIITSDHSNVEMADQCQSLPFLQSNFPWIYLDGISNGTLIHARDLVQTCIPESGVIILSRRDGQPFNVTPMEAPINFDNNSSINQLIYYPYIPGNNRDAFQNVDLIVEGLTVRVPYQPYQALQFSSGYIGELINDNPLRNPNSTIRVNYGNGSPGDSGAPGFTNAGVAYVLEQTDVYVGDLMSIMFNLQAFTDKLVGVNEVNISPTINFNDFRSIPSIDEVE